MPACLSGFLEEGRLHLCGATRRRAFRSSLRASRCAVTVGGGGSAPPQLPEALLRIVRSFQAVPDPMLRYKQLLFYASRLKPLPVNLQTSENKVQGCVSQVWVVPSLREGRVFFAADSDSALTKGLAALLVEGLSGSTPAEVLAVTPSFVEQLGLRQSLTPSRNNGFINMLALMQRKTLQLTNSCGPGEGDGPGGKGGQAAVVRVAEAQPATGSRPVRDAVVAKLDSLKPTRLRVVDDSASHAGHNSAAGLRPTETHFTVDIVSPVFVGKNAVQRHRLVYALLAEELAGGLHALSLTTRTPAEAEEK